MVGIYLGLGSNLGNREDNFSQCVNHLSEIRDIDIKKLSSIYETEPHGFFDQPMFLNMVIEIETQMLPDQLLDITQHVEKKMGKKKYFQWGPRLIDIDILSYQNRVINKKKITLPHQQMHRRKFVLVPLNEIAPNFFHPLLYKNINQLLNECRDELKVTKIITSKKLIS